MCILLLFKIYQAAGNYTLESNEKCGKTDTNLPTDSYTILEGKLLFLLFLNK